MALVTRALLAQLLCSDGRPKKNVGMVSPSSSGRKEWFPRQPGNLDTEELHKDMLLAPTAIVERKLTALGHWVRLLSHEFSLPCLSLAAWSPRAKCRRGWQPTTFSSCVCKQLHIDRLGDVGDMCLNRERWRRLVEQCCVEKEQQHLVDVAKHRDTFCVLDRSRVCAGSQPRRLEPQDACTNELSGLRD